MLQSKISIGKLDRRIVIQSVTSSSDVYNQPVTTYSTFATVWAEVRDSGGSEGFQADQLTASRTTLFTIRFLTGVRETMRILYNYRYYNIRSIKNPDRNRSLEITAELLDDPEDSVESEGVFDETHDYTFE